MYYLDKSASIFCGWSAQGIEALTDHVDVFVIIDVLSFSTCVDIATARGGMVYPYACKDDSAIEYARSIGGISASTKRSKNELSLSSYSLRNINEGVKLVLPSPNGSHLSTLTRGKPTLAGCLRNARAVGAKALTLGDRVAVIPAGERWEDGSIRFALEDWLGAGAIISELAGERTAEAEVAAQAIRSAGDLDAILRASASGIELVERGFPEDVELAAQLNVSDKAPMLINGAYQRS